jgi:RNA polymerase sigma factor (sigma-70 family)
VQDRRLAATNDAALGFLVESAAMERTETSVTFFSEEYPRLVRAMYLLAGDASEAQDLAQEALTRVFERWDRVRRIEDPVGYVYRVAFNHYRRSFRTILRERARLPLRSEGIDPTAASDTEQDLAGAIRRLPLAEREAIVAAAWLEMSTEEIATILGIKPASVRSRLHRARQHLAGLRSETRD